MASISLIKTGNLVHEPYFKLHLRQLITYAKKEVRDCLGTKDAMLGSKIMSLVCLLFPTDQSLRSHVSQLGQLVIPLIVWSARLFLKEDLLHLMNQPIYQSFDADDARRIREAAADFEDLKFRLAILCSGCLSIEGNSKLEGIRRVGKIWFDPLQPSDGLWWFG